MNKEIDIVDIQSLALNAEITAERLMKEHNGNLIQIKKEIAKIAVPRIKGFNFRDEVLWAANWLATKR